MASEPSAEEIASFNWGGQRARPRKKIEANWLKGQTYLKPPVSCGTKFPGKSISVKSITFLENMRKIIGCGDNALFFPQT